MPFIRPRRLFTLRSWRGDPRHGPGSREGTLAHMTLRDAAVGEGPIKGPRGGRARGNSLGRDGTWVAAPSAPRL